MFGRKGVQLATIVVVIGISYGSLAFTINRPCTEEESNKISATYNRTVFYLRGTAGICLYEVTYHYPQLQRELVACLNKSLDPVCAGDNYTNPCTAVGATEVNGTTQKTYFYVTTGMDYIVTFKFTREGHFYQVEGDICWFIWNTSKVQGGNSSSITSPPPNPTPNPGGNYPVITSRLPDTTQQNTENKALLFFGISVGVVVLELTVVCLVSWKGFK